MAKQNSGGIGIDAGPIPANVGARTIGPPVNGQASAQVTPYPRDQQMPGKGAMKTSKNSSSGAFGKPTNG